MKELHSVPKIANARFCALENNRIVIAPSCELKSDQRVLLKAISRQIKIHPSIYSITGRSYIDVLWLSIQKKSAGYYLACADIKKAFPNTQIDQIKKILRTDKISPIYDDFLGLNRVAIKIINSDKTYRGLAEGFPASSFLFARYLSKALLRLTEFRPYNSIAVWCDDILMFGKTRNAVFRTLSDFSWQLKKLDNISKIHKANKKAPKIFGPDDVWPVLGFEIGETMTSKRTNEKPILRHKNALHLLNSIKKLKELALKAKDQQVLEKLEELLPTTPISSKQPTDKSNSWMKKGFPNFNSHSYYNTGGQRNSTSFDQRSSREAAGVGCSVTLPNFSQTEVIKCFSFDYKNVNAWYSKFRKNPSECAQNYIHLRNELWAYFIAFYGSGLLTQLWHGQKDDILTSYKARNPDIVIKIRSTYIAELRMIDSGLPPRLKSLDSEISHEDLKRILRGYATSIMILIETDCLKPISPVCEYEIGRFRYPTQGFETVVDFYDKFGKRRFSASEIHDLERINFRFKKSQVSERAVGYVVDRLIERKVEAPSDGIFMSNFREPVDGLFVEYYDDLFYNKILRNNTDKIWNDEEKYFRRSDLLFSIPSTYGLDAKDVFGGGLYDH